MLLDDELYRKAVKRDFGELFMAARATEMKPLSINPSYVTYVIPTCGSRPFRDMSDRQEGL